MKYPYCLGFPRLVVREKNENLWVTPWVSESKFPQIQAQKVPFPYMDPQVPNPRHSRVPCPVLHFTVTKFGRGVNLSANPLGPFNWPDRIKITIYHGILPTSHLRLKHSLEMGAIGPSENYCNVKMLYFELGRLPPGTDPTRLWIWGVQMVPCMRNHRINVESDCAVRFTWNSFQMDRLRRLAFQTLTRITEKKYHGNIVAQS